MFNCSSLAAQSNLQRTQCPTSGSGGNNCFADFLGVHLTSGSSAYLEVSFDNATAFSDRTNQYAYDRLTGHVGLARRSRSRFRRKHSDLPLEWSGNNVRVPGTRLVDRNWSARSINHFWINWLTCSLPFLASEHHINYQYFLKGAANHYIGLAQTETVRVLPCDAMSAMKLRYSF